eukprot:TRINITY_DN19807_c0_g1_i1.p1 TRINITY_DN19807_c0_g1~~TRINITY_DN19807_c0_g1_i1.p1  ORF type:complete len:348 (+),score=77.41 TRINITY_DN19807_c0_g1_i1:118-1161(+)
MDGVWDVVRPEVPGGRVQQVWVVARPMLRHTAGTSSGSVSGARWDGDKVEFRLTLRCGSELDIAFALRQDERVIDAVEVDASTGEVFRFTLLPSDPRPQLPPAEPASAPAPLPLPLPLSGSPQAAYYGALTPIPRMPHSGAASAAGRSLSPMRRGWSPPHPPLPQLPQQAPAEGRAAWAARSAFAPALPPQEPSCPAPPPADRRAMLEMRHMIDSLAQSVESSRRLDAALSAGPPAQPPPPSPGARSPPAELGPAEALARAASGRAPEPAHSPARIAQEQKWAAAAGGVARADAAGCDEEEAYLSASGGADLLIMLRRELLARRPSGRAEQAVAVCECASRWAGGVG